MQLKETNTNNQYDRRTTRTTFCLKFSQFCAVSQNLENICFP